MGETVQAGWKIAFGVSDSVLFGDRAADIPSEFHIDVRFVWHAGQEERSQRFVS
jgi:hypothetical protein